MRRNKGVAGPSPSLDVFVADFGAEEGSIMTLLDSTFISVAPLYLNRGSSRIRDSDYARF